MLWWLDQGQGVEHDDAHCQLFPGPVKGGQFFTEPWNGMYGPELILGRSSVAPVSADQA